MPTALSVQFVLASASPARRRLLEAAGLSPVVHPSGADESLPEGVPAAEAVALLAVRKARAVADLLANGTGHATTRTLVLGCDSMFALDGELLGKPADAADATRRWHQMRGHHGVLYTGHCLLETGSDTEAVEVVATTVHFGNPDDAELAAYVATGEPLEVAGAFTLDGRGSAFIDRIDGDAGNVIGVSLPAVRRLLGAHGVTLADLWGAA